MGDMDNGCPLSPVSEEEFVEITSGSATDQHPVPGGSGDAKLDVKADEASKTLASNEMESASCADFHYWDKRFQRAPTRQISFEVRHLLCLGFAVIGIALAMASASSPS